MQTVSAFLIGGRFTQPMEAFGPGIQRALTRSRWPEQERRDLICSRSVDSEAQDGVVDLPGVMSRKKQVAPKLLAALAGGGGR